MLAESAKVVLWSTISGCVPNILIIEVEHLGRLLIYLWQYECSKEWMDGVPGGGGKLTGML